MHANKSDHLSKTNMHYMHFGIMIVLSFISMYVLMYAMVDRFSNVYPNFNQLYMAGLMTAPMVLIEMVLMREMYQNKSLNRVILSLGVVALIGFFLLVRQQTAISDTQFLKSMIPHHASAILMCEKAPIQDVEIRELCRNILTGQQAEIDQMKRKLSALEAS